MRYKYGNTLCVSTQVGCRMGCAFCASTLNGCVRNLEAGEILSFVACAEQDVPCQEGRKRSVTNLVLMGSGEPLDNYENVVRFLRLVSAPEGMNISPRNISLSTCGLVPQLRRFMQEAPHVTLSVSLHAPNDAIRNEIMPVNAAYPMAELLAAAKEYAVLTGRRVILNTRSLKTKQRAQACRGACFTPSRDQLPCKPDPAQPRCGTRAYGCDAPGGGAVYGMAYGVGHIRYDPKGNGNGY